MRVLELATVVMGPYGVQLLGDLGADIIKVESKYGDGSRVIGGGPHPQLSGIALNLHRNKRSIVVDLKHSEGIQILLDLLEDIDVFVTNLRPDPLTRLGLDHLALKDRFPRLIHCQAQGFRSGTDESNRPAYDDIIQALAGFPQLNEMAFGESHFIPSIITDKVAGMFIAQGVLAALYEREQSGLGQGVEIPMFDTGLAFNLVEHLGRAAVADQPVGYNRSLTPHRGPHRTADGYIAMIPYTNNHWSALFEAVGKTNLLEAPMFASTRSRIENADEVYRILAEIIRERPSQEWLVLCTQLGVPVASVPSLEDIVENEEHHRGVLRDVEHPVIGPYRHIQQPIRFTRSEQASPGPAPLLAQHTFEILTEIGRTPEEITTLLDAEVVRSVISEDGR